MKSWLRTLAAAHPWGLLGRRTAAYGTDVVLLFVLLAPTSLVLQRLLKITPESGPAIWQAALLSFSLPSWLYFIISDQSQRGATVGKRLFHIQVRDQTGQRLSLGTAAGRTALKLMPWELTHLVFVFSSTSDQWNQAQTLILITGNLLLIGYYGSAILTGGRRSVHDFIMGTHIRSTDTQV